MILLDRIRNKVEKLISREVMAESLYASGVELLRELADSNPRLHLELNRDFVRLILKIGYDHRLDTWDQSTCLAGLLLGINQVSVTHPKIENIEVDNIQRLEITLANTISTNLRKNWVTL
jgi:transcriptional antiterminator